MFPLFETYTGWGPFEGRNVTLYNNFIYLHAAKLSEVTWDCIGTEDSDVRAEVEVTDDKNTANSWSRSHSC